MGWWFAPWYDRCCARSEREGLAEARRALLEDLHGTVLEIGAGTGLNLPWYPDAVDRLMLVEPDPGMRARLLGRVAASGRTGLEVLDAVAERLPLDDASVDAVVGTLVLCSISDPLAAAREVRRVLRPGGTWRFFEHVAHVHRGWHATQRVIEPVWVRVAGGCHLTRRAVDVMVEAGFDLHNLERTEIPGAPPWLRPAVRGVAVRT